MPQNKAAHSLKSSLSPAFPSAERITSLKELMELEEQRSTVENTLQSLQDRIDFIQRELFSPDNRHVRSGLRELRRSRIPNRRRMARGELRAQILQQLETAGAEGVNVHAIAARLGMKAVNIHSWFHTALKRFPQIHKSGPSHYHLSGSLSGGLSESPRFVPSVLDFSAPSNPTPATSSSTRRGEVTKSIIKALREAGKEGLTVSELADCIGSSYRRVHVWLSSTGKKNQFVVRLARGTYRIDERLESPTGESVA